MILQPSIEIEYRKGRDLSSNESPDLVSYSYEIRFPGEDILYLNDVITFVILQIIIILFQSGTENTQGKLNTEILHTHVEKQSLQIQSKTGVTC